MEPNSNLGDATLDALLLKRTQEAWIMNDFLLSMNVLLCASRVWRYGFTICKTNIGFMEAVDLNIS